MPKAKAKKLVKAKQVKPKARLRKKPVKKVAQRTVQKEKPIGRVIHFYDKLSVAVLKLAAPLAVGDVIRIVGGKATDFTQKVVSMQVNYQPLKKAKKGQEIGLRIKETARDGYKVFRA